MDPMKPAPAPKTAGKPAGKGAIHVLVIGIHPGGKKQPKSSSKKSTK